jgi:hypothetical protein
MEDPKSKKRKECHKGSVRNTRHKSLMMEHHQTKEENINLESICAVCLINVDDLLQEQEQELISLKFMSSDCGHCVCEPCTQNIGLGSACPVCRVSGKWSRNYSFERVIQMLLTVAYQRNDVQSQHEEIKTSFQLIKAKHEELKELVNSAQQTMHSMQQDISRSNKKFIQLSTESLARTSLYMRLNRISMEQKAEELERQNKFWQMEQGWKRKYSFLFSPEECKTELERFGIFELPFQDSECIQFSSYSAKEFFINDFLNSHEAKPTILVSTYTKTIFRYSSENLLLWFQTSWNNERTKWFFLRVETGWSWDKVGLELKMKYKLNSKSMISFWSSELTESAKRLEPLTKVSHYILPINYEPLVIHAKIISPTIRLLFVPNDSNLEENPEVFQVMKESYPWCVYVYPYEILSSLTYQIMEIFRKLNREKANEWTIKGLTDATTSITHHCMVSGERSLANLGLDKDTKFIVEFEHWKETPSVTYVSVNEKALELKPNFIEDTSPISFLLSDEKQTDYFIIAKGLDGKKRRINTVSWITVGELRQHFSKASGICLEQVRLIFRGSSLPDEKTLYQCRVERGNVIHLILQMRGS